MEWKEAVVPVFQALTTLKKPGLDEGGFEGGTLSSFMTSRVFWT
jgi:hypothetical protein